MDFEERKKKIEEIMARFYRQLAQLKKEKKELIEKLEQERAEEEIEAIKKDLEGLIK